MEGTLKVLSLLEGSKFSSTNDISVLLAATDLVYHENKGLWDKGTKVREQLNDLLSGELTLNSEAYIKSSNLDELVMFLQGITMLAISLVNGIGRSPITVKKNDPIIEIRITGNPLPIKLTKGKYNAEMEKLVDQFKKLFYGQAADKAFTSNEIKVIAEAFSETTVRLKTEMAFIKKIIKDPANIFNATDKNLNFASTLFLILSSLPTNDLNNIMINIGSYLPEELEEFNEDNFKVVVKNYLTNSTVDMHELFKKIRLLLKLYFGKNRNIISVIVKEKTKNELLNILANKKTAEQIKDNLKTAAENQFELRIKILSGLIKLLR